MVTIQDVARQAGVSVATVSRVINNKNTVTGSTAQKVGDAIRELGYEPNLMARNFRLSETRVILVLTPNLTNPFYGRILTGIGTEARQRGYSTMICTTSGSNELELEYLSMCEKRRADGAIMLATSLERGKIEQFASRWPLVQCAEFYPGTCVAHVAVDSYEAAKRMVALLIAQGHRRIGTISSTNSYQSTKRRLAGYQDALREAGIEPNAALVVNGSDDYSFASGSAAAKKLLQQKQPPTAIFCISDMLALGAIQGAKDLGLSVPEDLAIAGFDDVEYATTFHPYITTMAQPCFELGTQSASLLIRLMQGEKEIEREVVLSCDLRERETTAPLRGKANKAI